MPETRPAYAGVHQPFDARLAEFPTGVVPIDRVIDLLAVSHAPDRISVYRDAMIRGDRFPPVSVLSLAGRFVVADGHKRLTAYRAFGTSEILVEVWPFGRFVRDQLDQARANARKNREIAVRCVTDPREARRLLLATLLHWRRVVVSLAASGQTLRSK